jgi:uncharacterized protein DUF2510
VTATAQPAWHADPTGAASWRYWDGTTWTERTAPEGQLGLLPLQDAVGESLMLHQQIGAGTDLLQLGDAVVGRMDKPFMGEVTGHVSSGSWAFDRQGITQNTLDIRALPANQSIALFAWEGIGTGTDGTLSFSSGRTVRLESGEKLELRRTPAVMGDAAPTGGEWTFLGADGVPLVTSRLAWPEPKTRKIFGKTVTYTTTRSGTGRTTSNVVTDVRPGAASAVELPLLVILGTYLAWWTGAVRESVHRGR